MILEARVAVERSWIPDLRIFQACRQLWVVHLIEISPRRQFTAMRSQTLYNAALLGAETDGLKHVDSVTLASLQGVDHDRFEKSSVAGESLKIDQPHALQSELEVILPA